MVSASAVHQLPAIPDPKCRCRPCRHARGELAPAPGRRTRTAATRDGGDRCRICNHYRVAAPGLNVCTWHVPDEIGVTYQQLAYWAKLEYLHPERPPVPGRGRMLSWPAAELEVARLMGRLINQAGISLKLAARIARSDDTTFALAPGIVLEVTR